MLDSQEPILSTEQQNKVQTMMSSAKKITFTALIFTIYHCIAYIYTLTLYNNTTWNDAANKWNLYLSWVIDVGVIAFLCYIVKYIKNPSAVWSKTVRFSVFSVVGIYGLLYFIIVTAYPEIWIFNDGMLYPMPTIFWWGMSVFPPALFDFLLVLYYAYYFKVFSSIYEELHEQNALPNNLLQSSSSISISQPRNYLPGTGSIAANTYQGQVSYSHPQSSKNRRSDFIENENQL